MSPIPPGSSFDESELLSNCPSCTYQLQGLPIVHHCPECGFEVDRRWRIFGGVLMPRKSREGTRALQVFVLVWTCVPTAIVTVSVQLVPTPPLVRYLLLFVMAGAIGAVLWTLFRQPRAFVTVGDDGVGVYWNRRKFERFAWDDVKKMQHDLLRKRLLLTTKERDVPIRTFDLCGWHIGEADRCVSGVNHYARPTQSSPRSGG